MVELPVISKVLTPKMHEFIKMRDKPPTATGQTLVSIFDRGLVKQPSGTGFEFELSEVIKLQQDSSFVREVKKLLDEARKLNIPDQPLLLSAHLVDQVVKLERQARSSKKYPDTEVEQEFKQLARNLIQIDSFNNIIKVDQGAAAEVAEVIIGMPQAEYQSAMAVLEHSGQSAVSRTGYQMAIRQAVNILQASKTPLVGQAEVNPDGEQVHVSFVDIADGKEWTGNACYVVNGGGEIRVIYTRDQEAKVVVTRIRGTRLYEATDIIQGKWRITVDDDSKNELFIQMRQQVPELGTTKPIALKIEKIRKPTQ